MATVNLHLKRADATHGDITKIDLDTSMFDDNEKIKTIDAFIYRFVKLQDYMGDKLFKELLKSLAEYKDNMSMLDVVDRLEKLEIIDSADRWLDYREARNKLTHEYPDNEDEIVQGIQISLVYFQEIKKIVEDIQVYIDKNGLMK